MVGAGGSIDQFGAGLGRRSNRLPPTFRALDLLPDNHPNVDPASLFLQITALREAEPAVA